VARHGRLDVLCNIAGIMIDSSIIDLDPDEFDRILSVNLKGVLYGCQAAGKVMTERGGGSIINMSSAAVLTPSPGIGPYAICKAGVAQLTQSMAVEVGQHNVRVNSIAPGFVPTNMTARYYTDPDGHVNEEMKAAVLTPMARHAPLRRVGLTNDVAYCVLYLASDASSFVTGQLISPNGGVAMHY
jgi:3-oxoacyl-[acyl-carrier protein] reductase